MVTSSSLTAEGAEGSEDCAPDWLDAKSNWLVTTEGASSR
jgi:hypothetical protein